jgi:hypothetical protein
MLGLIEFNSGSGQQQGWDGAPEGDMPIFLA